MTSAIVKLKADLPEDGSEESEKNISLITDTENSEDYLELDEVVDCSVSIIIDFSKIEHMRCALHTLQLAIRDDFKEKNVHTLIGYKQWC